MTFHLPRLAPFRLRILFRGVFFLLALATIALALYVLQQEKQLGYKNYQYSFGKTRQQIAATLRHPAGQLALLNPRTQNARLTPLRPLLLPFSAIDFDDQQKTQQAVDMSGCLVQYQDQGALCVAIGNNPWAGGFIYVAGNFYSGDLVAHRRGDLELNQSHRVRVSVAMRGRHYRWLAPYEAVNGVRKNARAYGKLTGFIAAGGGAADEDPRAKAQFVKDFRGWIWQSQHCAGPAGGHQRDERADCARSAFFSLRLPVSVLQDALFDSKLANQRPVWPPLDLDQIEVHVEVLPPGDGAPLFDSNSASAVAPFSLADLTPLLLPGETLRVRRPQTGEARDLITLVGAEQPGDESWPLLGRLVRQLPVAEYDTPIAAREQIATPAGVYDLLLTGDVRSVNNSLAVAATRVSWFVVAMLLALLFAWFVIEARIIRRIAILTKRAASLSKTVKGAGGLGDFDLSDLRGVDELGVLASCLYDLLRRVREDVEREAIRAEQEKEMWHAVGHEIMSPLQSLMALHGAGDSQSSRYINRMQQAVRVLYGSASPSEAFQSTVLQVKAIDIDAFLANVAGNAPCVGIDNVVFNGGGSPVMVRADDYSLEDVVTHVLRNAERYRPLGSPITITLRASETAASIAIHNQGPNIADDLIGKIFEYGVSDQHDAAANGNRGQGLFVAKTYMAKMGGTIVAQNVADGVEIVLGLQRGAG